jgi:hypothetical protein
MYPAESQGFWRISGIGTALKISLFRGGMPFKT